MRRLSLLLAAAFCLPALPARALPIFAHRYGFSCQQCHTTVPQLNAFGEAFKARGFRLPAGGRGVVPVAVKVNLAYSSAPDAGLPKAVVDEVEILSGGSLGRNASYFVEQYAVDGGERGRTRDAWIQLDRFAPANDPDGTALHVRAGQFTLPLPVDPESFRPTLQHYAVFDQAVGANAFDFFDPRIGVDLSSTNLHSGIEAHVLALSSYDRSSGVPVSGVDLMASFAKAVTPNLMLQTYRYQGQRHLSAANDRFWRQGFGAEFARAHLTLDSVVQSGFDSAAGDFEQSVRSSGGFVQADYAFDSAVQLVARYDGTYDAINGQQRSGTLSLVLRPHRNMRFTIEGVQSGDQRTLGLGLMFAY